MSDENLMNQISGVEIRPGDVEAVLDLIRTARILQDYINDQTAHGIADLTSTVLKLTNAIMCTDLIEVMERAVQDPELDKAILNPPKIGLTGVIKEMGDEDFQKGMGVMLTLVKAIGRAAEE